MKEKFEELKAKVKAQKEMTDEEKAASKKKWGRRGLIALAVAGLGLGAYKVGKAVGSAGSIDLDEGDDLEYLDEDDDAEVADDSEDEHPAE